MSSPLPPRPPLPTLCIDFDGVLSDYQGWKGPHSMDPPLDHPALSAALRALHQHYILVIFSVRPKNNILEWLEKYDLDQFITSVTDHKPPAVAYIDDRGYKFERNWDGVLQQFLPQPSLGNRPLFETHWERAARYAFESSQAEQANKPEESGNQFAKGIRA